MPIADLQITVKCDKSVSIQCTDLELALLFKVLFMAKNDHHNVVVHQVRSLWC